MAKFRHRHMNYEPAGEWIERDCVVQEVEVKASGEVEIRLLERHAESRMVLQLSAREILALITAGTRSFKIICDSLGTATNAAVRPERS